MAKKISIEEYEKEQKAKKKLDNKKDIIKIISLIVNGVLVIGLIILIIMYSNIKSHTYSKEEYGSMLDEKNGEIEDLEYDLDRVLNGKDIDYIEDKLYMMDKSIVFQIKGYGNYYYSYDCMMKKVGNKDYRYWAYNKEAAKDYGLKKGSC